jgi:hypothetical protein
MTGMHNLNDIDSSKTDLFKKKRKNKKNQEKG